MRSLFKGTLLVVDDDPHVLAALRRLFKRTPVQVRTAASGLEALSTLDRCHVDLVITDQRMPIMCGSRLIEEIKRRHPDVHCMVLSGYSDHQALAQAINTGRVLRFIPKPWNDDDLKNAVLQVINECHDRRQQQEHGRSDNALLRMLRVALRKGDLRLHYQPKIDLASNQLCGVEALCRWTTPDGSIIPPVRFIPLAESRQLIEPLGNWVLNQACWQLRQWQQQSHLKELPLAVNISPGQLIQTDFVDNLTDTLRTHELQPSHLILELTESTMLSSDPITRHNTKQLQRLGITLAIDDFGSEYANFSYISNHRFDQLKLDKSLIDDIESRERQRRVVEAILQLANAIGMDVVAEGVERAEQAEILRLMGCKTVQGFLFSPALTPEQFEQSYLQRRRAS